MIQRCPRALLAQVSLVRWLELGQSWMWNWGHSSWTAGAEMGAAQDHSGGADGAETGLGWVSWCALHQHHPGGTGGVGVGMGKTSVGWIPRCTWTVLEAGWSTWIMFLAALMHSRRGAQKMALFDTYSSKESCSSFPSVWQTF